MRGKNLTIIILSIVVAVQGYALLRAYAPNLLSFGGGFSKPKIADEMEIQQLVNKFCSLTPYALDGESLAPAYADGSRHVFYTGDKCPLAGLAKRDEVVVITTGQAEKPVAKFIKAVPGDTFALDRRAGGISVLTVNGVDVKNSVGRAYNVQRDRQAMIAMYVRDYNGIIPANAYLVLGDNVDGTLDSTMFGLVNIKDITGVMRREDKENKEDKGE